MFDIAESFMQLRDGHVPQKKNMPLTRKLPPRAECPDMGGSDCDHHEVRGNKHTQKCMGD